ncbi:hypothetical protein RHS02_02324, partial [Rhizoctonia solani]
MANAPLHPIVIQAFVTGPFECLGEGLLHDGIGREEPDTLKSLIAPTKTSKRVAIEDRERPKKWWKAQCLHYGLQVPSAAPISTYRVHLENGIRQRGGLKLPQDLASLELEQNSKFRHLNAQVREATSRSSTQTKPSQAKAKLIQSAPTAALESAPKTKGKSKPKTEPEPKAKEPRPKAEPESKIQPKAKPEKTKSKPKAKSSAGASGDAADSKQTTTSKRKAETVVHHVYHYDGDRLDQAAATSIVGQETGKRPAKKARTAAPPADRDHSPDLPPSYSQAVSCAKQTARRTGASAPRGKQTARRHRFWKLNGHYEINCTSEEQWSLPNCRPCISIRFGDSNLGEPDFEGLLELPGFMTCVLRLKEGAPPPDDGYVRFEWCGQENETGEILTPSMSQVGWLKVHPEQLYIKGMITGCCGEFTFNGNKVGPEDLEGYTWEDFGKDAYEEANRRRWG